MFRRERFASKGKSMFAVNAACVEPASIGKKRLEYPV
jgi:hypothetical protein